MILKSLLRNSFIKNGQQATWNLFCKQKPSLTFMNQQCYLYKQSSHVRSPSFLADKERVRDFLTILNTNEKRILYEELQLEHNELTRNPTIIVVDSSSGSSKDSVDCSNQSPTYSQLGQMFIAQALPFIGFGFLDNLLMIVAGDYIDLTIGVTLGISTMAAAGLGNALSDVAGVGSAFYVERIAARVGMKPPKLSISQLQMSSTRWAIQIGRAIGVAIGCLLGMLPLLFLPHREHSDRNENQPKNQNVKDD